MVPKNRMVFFSVSNKLITGCIRDSVLCDQSIYVSFKYYVNVCSIVWSEKRIRHDIVLKEVSMLRKLQQLDRRSMNNRMIPIFFIFSGNFYFLTSCENLK